MLQYSEGGGDIMIRVHLSNILGDRRYTQKHLASITKIRPNTINALYHETAKHISFAQLNRICEALDCSISDIIEYIPSASKKAEEKTPESANVTSNFTEK